MTRKETIDRNIGLTFDFVHHLMEHEEELNKLPDNFNVEFIDKVFQTIEKKAQMVRSVTKIPKKYVRVKTVFETI